MAGNATASPALSDDAGTELTLRRALARALLESPDLQAFGLDVRAAEARIVEAGLYTNPELEVGVDEFGGTGELSGMDAAEFSISLAQTFPLGGDIKRRREVAGYEARMAGWNYEAARIDVLTDVTRRYLSVLAAQRRLALAQQELELAQAVLSTIQKRVEAGAAAEVEMIRARVPVAEAKVRVQRWLRQLQTARRQLALSWGEQEPRFDKVLGELDRLEAPPAPQSLAHLISQNPRVAQWATQISSHRARVAVARAEAVPDVTAGVGIARFNETDETALAVGISLPLPFFDRNQGEIRASPLDAEAAEQRKRATERLLEGQLSSAWTQMANAYGEATALKKEALPTATEAFEVTRRAFEQGDVEFIDVLDAERTLMEIRNQYVTALIDYHNAVTEIESLIGQSVSEIDTADSTSNPQNQE